MARRNHFWKGFASGAAAGAGGTLGVLLALNYVGRAGHRRVVRLEKSIQIAAPVEDVFLCLVSNVSPWTYLGTRPVNPSPEASFDAGLDVFAMGAMGPLRMLRTLRQTLSRTPDARGRGVHRRHDLEELSLTASRPQGWQLDGDHMGTATGLRVRHVPAALRVVS